MTIERSPERDAAVAALLPRVAATGWTRSALIETAGPDADLLFPAGPADMVEAYSDLADRWMEEDAASTGVASLRVPQRIRTVIGLRLERNRPFKAAIRRGLAVLARPANAPALARATARTLDAIWHAAGDRSADSSWYTKRATLAAVYGATLLYWLGDDAVDDEATLAFLDRRLADVAGIGRLRARLFPPGPGGSPRP